MRIDSISFTHFRCFGVDGQPCTFRFGPGINVFVGENAAGKTALLDGVVAGLGAFYLGLDDIKPGTGYTGTISKSDATRVLVDTPGLTRARSLYPVTLACSGTLADEPVQWTRTLSTAKGRTDSKGARELRDRVARMTDEQAVTTLPVLAYYGHGRLWDIRKDFPHEVIDGAEERLTAYARALESKSDRKAVLAWWQRVELAAEQRAVGGGPLPEHAILTAALVRALPGARSVRFDGVLGQPTVTFADRITPFAELSAGYQNILGIMLDLIYRVTRLNPHLGVDAARRTPGVVLVDEIDQHLHPKWQRQVLGDLRATFPEVQFILTTHAPQVLVGAEAGEVHILRRDDDGRIHAEQLDIPPGLRADEVLTGQWFGLPSTLDPDTVQALERHRQMLRDGAPADHPGRQALEAELRRRLGRFHDTSLEGLALSVLAELTAERPARTAEARARLKADLRARLAARMGSGPTAAP